MLSQRRASPNGFGEVSPEDFNFIFFFTRALTLDMLRLNKVGRNDPLVLLKLQIADIYWAAHLSSERIGRAYRLYKIPNKMICYVFFKIFWKYCNYLFITAFGMTWDNAIKYNMISCNLLKSDVYCF